MFSTYYIPHNITALKKKRIGNSKKNPYTFPTLLLINSITAAEQILINKNIHSNNPADMQFFSFVKWVFPSVSINSLNLVLNNKNKSLFVALEHLLEIFWFTN